MRTILLLKNIQEVPQLRTSVDAYRQHARMGYKVDLSKSRLSN